MSKKYEIFDIKIFIKEDGMGIGDAYILAYIANAEASQFSLAKASRKDIIKFLFWKVKI